MAFPDQIAAADYAGRTKPMAGDGFVDGKARHILTPIGLDQADLDRAARLLTRQQHGGDLADMLGLTLPAAAPDIAQGLMSLTAASRYAGARAWIGDLTRGEIDALRAALRRRREDR